jgi:hypothetical protein
VNRYVVLHQLLVCTTIPSRALRCLHHITSARRTDFFSEQLDLELFFEHLTKFSCKIIYFIETLVLKLNGKMEFLVIFEILWGLLLSLYYAFVALATWIMPEYFSKKVEGEIVLVIANLVFYQFKLPRYCPGN